MLESREHDRLFEELTLTRNVTESVTPMFTHLSKNYDQRSWNWLGGPWAAHSNRKRPNDRLVTYTNAQGKFHREFGPAYINAMYDEEAWFYNGVLHNETGWAYRHRKNMVWFKHGKLHNLSGPAVIEGAGPPQFWIDGVKYTRKQYTWEIQRRRRYQQNADSKSTLSCPASLT